MLLYTTRLTVVEHYDAGDLTIGIGAGCTVAQLSAKVAANNLFFAADPALPEQCTLGGLLATGLYGPHRHGYGGLRDYCIGVRFITGDARKAKGGGRVVKNVAGYDMMKLLIGSYGTLGIITSASFKLFPAPRQTRTFVADFANAAEAIEFRNRVLHSPLDPICLELVSPEAGGLLASAAPTLAAGSGRSASRASGSDTVLARYRAELGTAVVHEVEGQSEHDLWRALSDFSHLVPQRHPRSVLISMTLPLGEVQALLDGLAMVAQSHSLKLATVGRVGVGHLLAAMWPAPLAESRHEFRRRRLRTTQPFAPRRQHGRPPAQPKRGTRLRRGGRYRAISNSMRAVKLALDPKDILNRGRFLV